MRKTTARAVRARVLLAYAVLYLVWGSTYLAMKVAVTTIPPFVGAALRFAVSGLLLLLFGRMLDRTPITRGHLVGSVAQGVLLLVCGNAAVMFAMRVVPSGVGALVIATTPLFMTLFARDFRRQTWIGVMLGLVGVAVLVDPFASDREVPLWGLGLLVLAAASWGLGAAVLKLLPVHPDNATATGLQMLTGALVQAILSIASGESLSFAATTSSSWWALLYLAVMGSLVGFTSYGWLLKVEPASRVATYAYVNPIVAVVLGAALGDEPMSARVVVAGAVIVSAVIVILKARR